MYVLFEMDLSDYPIATLYVLWRLTCVHLLQFLYFSLLLGIQAQNTSEEWFLSFVVHLYKHWSLGLVTRCVQWSLGLVTRCVHWSLGLVTRCVHWSLGLVTSCVQTVVIFFLPGLFQEWAVPFLIESCVRSGHFEWSQTCFKNGQFQFCYSDLLKVQPCYAGFQNKGLVSFACCTTLLKDWSLWSLWSVCAIQVCYSSGHCDLWSMVTGLCGHWSMVTVVYGHWSVVTGLCGLWSMVTGLCGHWSVVYGHWCLWSLWTVVTVVCVPFRPVTAAVTALAMQAC